MLSLNNDFIGYHPKEHAVAFSGSDTKELYVQNLKSKPNDWYYRANPISYVRNMHGHRCSEIEDIDLDNYILFSGCSNAEGIGLELEKTYPYLVSKALKCDYYNLGIGGTGIDVLAYNLITWFSTVKQKPKLVIIQWSHHARFMSKVPSDPEQHSYYPFGPWSKEVEAGRFLLAGHDIGFFDTRRTMMYNLIKNVINCPIIEITPPNLKFNNEAVLITSIKNDYARDQLHSGIFSNIKHANIIIDIIKDKYKHEFNNN
jgi:hypothetical protein